METVKRLKDMLIRHEGLKLKPYLCTAGKLTIGVGRNIQDRGITYQEAMMLLENDIRLIKAQLSQHEWFFSLDLIRKEVIIDMAFMGVAKLLGFKKMIAAIEKGDYREAAFEMLDSDWANQVGDRAAELALMMESGEYPPAN